MPENADHLILPFPVIRFLVLFDAGIPDFCEEFIIGTERPDKFYASRPSTGMVNDQKTPASIIPADLRPGQVYRAVGFFAPGLVPEERTGVREFFKDALVIEEFAFVGIDRDRRRLTGIIVVDQETVIAVLFPYHMDVPELVAAFPALEAFEGQGGSPLTNGPPGS